MVHRDQLELLEARRGKQLATAPGKRAEPRRFATLGDVVLSIDDQGTIKRYDAKLAPERTSTLPQCP